MASKERGFVVHPYEPVFSAESKVLLLGTIASPASRKNGFYYTHPHNRFWTVLSSVLNVKYPEGVEDKITMLQNNKIALWDVLQSAYITGASDTSIKNPVPNNLSLIFNTADIKAVFTTGKKAFDLYNKLCYKDTEMRAVCLPSTSPANCAYSLSTLVEQYSVMLNYLKERP